MVARLVGKGIGVDVGRRVDGEVIIEPVNRLLAGRTAGATNTPVRSLKLASSVCKLSIAPRTTVNRVRNGRLPAHEGPTEGRNSGVTRVGSATIETGGALADAVGSVGTTSLHDVPIKPASRMTPERDLVTSPRMKHLLRGFYS